jgi:hypothetical protein
MHDCMLIANVHKRGKELENFSNDLANIKSDFIDLVKQDEQYTGDLASENEIKRTIQDIKEQLK